MGLREISKEDFEKLCSKLGGEMRANENGMVCVVTNGNKKYIALAYFKAKKVPLDI